MLDELGTCEASLVPPKQSVLSICVLPTRVFLCDAVDNHALQLDLGQPGGRRPLT